MNKKQVRRKFKLKDLAHFWDIIRAFLVHDLVLFVLWSFLIFAV